MVARPPMGRREKSEKTLDRYNEKYNYKKVEKAIIDLYNNIENWLLKIIY